MFGTGYRLAYHQFFVEFFPRPQAGVFDGDITSIGILVFDVIAHEVDHFLRQVNDTNRLVHIQYKNIAPGSHRAGLNYQLGRFLYRHEIARHFRMGHRHRAAGTNLLAKQRYHRAGRAQHVAKPHYTETGRTLTLGDGLQHLFCKTLGRPHKISWSYCLIGRYQDEVFYLILFRGLGRNQGTKDVILDAFYDILFHHRHLLVRGHMVDGVYGKTLDGTFHLNSVTHRA